MAALAHGTNTNTGNVRQHNEDSYLADPQLGLWVVADGMGGHASGEVASAITRDTIGEQVKVGKSLTDAIQAAHHSIIDAANNGTGSPGMGSTVVALLVDGYEYEIGWVGDSRAYLWDGHLRQISKDHSFVQRLIDMGSISEEEALDHPDKNLIYQCLGSRELNDVSIGLIAGQFLVGQKILLCSDGLNDEVRDTAISTILKQNNSDQELVDKLINAALNNTGNDNVTVLLVSAPEDAPTELDEDDTSPFQSISMNIGAPQPGYWKYAAVLFLMLFALIIYYLLQPI